MSEPAIVVCADEPRLLVELPDQLRLDGYRSHTAQARRKLMWTLAERQPDAVVLGDLPSLSQTLGLLRELRGHETGGRVGVDPDVPVLVLSATAGEMCELRAFEAGADDFQPASVSYLLLRARGSRAAPSESRSGRCASTPAASRPATRGGRSSCPGSSSPCCTSSPASPSASSPRTSCSRSRASHGCDGSG